MAAGTQPTPAALWSPLRLAVGVASLAMLGGCAVYAKCGFGGCADDAQITSAVEMLFAQHADLQPPNLLSVQTLDRVVYLYGIVQTDLQRQAADAVAMQVAGVKRVVNSIGLTNR